LAINQHHQQARDRRRQRAAARFLAKALGDHRAMSTVNVVLAWLRLEMQARLLAQAS
jgi:hypothetical protein